MVSPPWRERMLVRNIEVQPGATIDFVTDCLDSPSHDSFEWEVQITYTDGMQFNSVSGFPERPQPALDVWAQAAQALLLSNELIFID